MPTVPVGLRYSAVARLLHWGLVPIILVQIYLGWSAGWEVNRPQSRSLYAVHFELGILILSLMLLRVSWKLAKAGPRADSTVSVGMRIAATTTHTLLYAVILTLPLSGYVLWVWMDGSLNFFGLFELPALFIPDNADTRSRYIAWVIHHYSALLLGGLVLIHVAAALWHELVLRDGLIRRRML